MTQHKLQLNREKTEAVLVKPRQKLSFISANTIAWRCHSSSLSLTLSKASAFSSTAHSPWRTSLVKPPNPAATSSVELVLSGSIFSPRLQRNWSPHSFCHASTTAVLSFLVFLLSLFIAIFAYRTVLLALYQGFQGPYRYLQVLTKNLPSKALQVFIFASQSLQV